MRACDLQCIVEGGYKVEEHPPQVVTLCSNVCVCMTVDLPVVVSNEVQLLRYCT